MAVGFIVAVIQAATQIQEQTLTFLPKLALMALVFAFTLPWALTRLVEYLAGDYAAAGEHYEFARASLERQMGADHPLYRIGDIQL